MTIRFNRGYLLGAAALFASLTVGTVGAAAEPEGAGPGRIARQTDQDLGAQAGKVAQQGQRSGQSGQSAATRNAGQGTQQHQATGQGQNGQGTDQLGGLAPYQGQNGQRAQQGTAAASQGQSGQRAQQGVAAAGQGQSGQRAQQGKAGQVAQGQSGRGQGTQGTSEPVGAEAARNYTGMNATFATPLANRCVYKATIRGVVAPAAAWNRSDMERNLHPDLAFQATLECPDQETVAVSGTIAPRDAITRSQLEAELERRATITSRDYAGRCAYAPDFIMTDNLFATRDVNYMCSLNWPLPNRK